MTQQEIERAREIIYERVKVFSHRALKAYEHGNEFRALYEACIVGMWMSQFGINGLHDPFREVLEENCDIDGNIVTSEKLARLREYSRVGRDAHLSSRPKI